MKTMFIKRLVWLIINDYKILNEIFVMECVFSASVAFQSELVGEFWYQLELYALPPPVLSLPLVCCQLGK